MIEGDWLTLTDPQAMLAFLREPGRANERKLRLFAVACCRRIWPQMTDGRSRNAVELAERSADEPVAYEVLDGVSAEAEETFEDSLTDDEGKTVGDHDPRPDAASAASYASSPGMLGAEHFSVVLEGASVASPLGAVQERAIQAAILRDLFGNPFRPLPTLPSSLREWHDGLIPRMATAIYDERVLPAGHLDPSRLAILADALLDAGCPAEHEVLSHLRGPGPHWRGCFAVDAVLGRQ